MILISECPKHLRGTFILATLLLGNTVFWGNVVFHFWAGLICFGATFEQLWAHFGHTLGTLWAHFGHIWNTAFTIVCNYYC